MVISYFVIISSHLHFVTLYSTKIITWIKNGKSAMQHCDVIVDWIMGKNPRPRT